MRMTTAGTACPCGASSSAGLVRLHPMVVMGTVLGACFYFFAQATVSR